MVFNRDTAGEGAWFFDAAEDLSGILGDLERMDPPELDAAGSAMRERIRGRFEWDGIVSRYADLLLRTAGEPVDPAPYAPSP